MASDEHMFAPVRVATLGARRLAEPGFARLETAAGQRRESRRERQPTGGSRKNGGVRRTIAGLLVDPIEGAVPGRLTFEDGEVTSVEEMNVPEAGSIRIFPGFIDLQIYDWSEALESGVTGYLATCGTSAPGVVEDFLDQLPRDPLCLGAHIEGPYLNAEAAGAQAEEHIRPIDFTELGRWLSAERVRMVTLAPELDGAREAIGEIVAAGAVAAIGHTATNARTTSLAVDAGVRFATHIWNAMTGMKAREPGAIGELLLDYRVTLGLIGDGRHLNPLIERLTVEVAGAERIALTSDRVPPPQQRPDGKLLGGDRCGAELVARAARWSIHQAAVMSSLVPARVLGLTDRGRLAPGYRADLAILDAAFTPLETIVNGETAWKAPQ